MVLAVDRMNDVTQALAFGDIPCFLDSARKRPISRKQIQ